MNLTGQWTISPTALAFPSGKAAAVMSGNKVILMGGLRGGPSTFTLDMLSATIHPDGSIDQFVPCGVLPSAPVTNIDAQYGAWGTRGNVLFLAAGSHLTACHTTHLSNDGSPGAWSTSLYAVGEDATGMPGILAKNGYIYVVGASDIANNNVSINVRAVKLNGDGSLGAWFLVNPVTIWPTASGIQGLGYGALCEVNGYLIYSGGADNDATMINAVWSAKLCADGTIGPWKLAGSMAPRISHAAVTVGDTALLIGGARDFAGGTPTGSCEALRIDAGGNVCSNTTLAAPPLDVRFINREVVFYNNRIYIFGGRTPSGLTDQIQVLNVAF